MKHYFAYYLNWPKKHKKYKTAIYLDRTCFALSESAIFFTFDT